VETYPWYWSGTDIFWYCMCLVVLVPGLLALVFGYFAFRSRIKGVYFSIITQAMTFAFMLLFFRNETGFGGNNGFTDFQAHSGLQHHRARHSAVLYLLTVALLAGSLFVGGVWRAASSVGC
jgi:urea transport system permease protein